MKSKIIKIGFFIFLLSTLFIFSCQKEINEENYDEQYYKSVSDEMTNEDVTYSFGDIDNRPVEGMDFDQSLTFRSVNCFRLKYPYSIQFPDLTVVTINSNFELLFELFKWRINNPKVKGKPSLVYPIAIKFEDGTERTVTSKEEMTKLIKECLDSIKNLKLSSCIKPVYPVTLQYPDGSTAKIQSSSELKKALTDWRQTHFQFDGHPVLKYPYDVQLENEGIHTINNLEDLKVVIKKSIVSHCIVSFK
jgi:hypothetical protein